MRIVSLIASSTEIVWSLGLGEEQVGRSHECDYPAQVTALPVLTEPKFPVDGTSAEIDRRVKQTLTDSVSVYRVFADRLEALAPDLVITQAQCEVCAVSERDVEAALCSFVSSRPKLVSLVPMALADLFGDVMRVAEAADVPERGRMLVTHLRGRMDEVARRAAALPRRRVAFVEWIEPLMSGGNWVPELVSLAGGDCLFGEAGKHSPWMTLEALGASDPDVVVVAPCGFDLPRTRAEMAPLAGAPAFRALRAVKEGRVFLADGNQFFNRPGPRLVESLEILAETLHPEVFHLGHEGPGWERWQG